MKKIVPIVFAINDGFVPYFGVAFHSLKQNASKDYQYHVYVFHVGMAKRSIELCEKQADENFDVKCIDVDSYMPAIDFNQTNHVSKETLYRLIIPKVLPQYDRVLWLDADMVILGDVSELYNFDIGDNVIGAVPELMHEYIHNYLMEHNMPTDDFFNTGVMIIDNKRMVEEEILEKSISFLSQGKYDFPDQDALNTICKGKVKLLPDVWNFLFDKKFKPGFEETEKRYLKAGENPKIIHYTGGGKPWIMPLRDKADEFWKYARQTMFYEDILYRNARRGLTPQASVNCFERYVFPWKLVNAGERIIIYGGGAVGKTFVEQMKLTGYCFVSAVADKRGTEIKGIEARIVYPSFINEVSYDKILIAVEKESISEEIRKELIELGVAADKILWANPLK